MCRVRCAAESIALLALAVLFASCAKDAPPKQVDAEVAHDAAAAEGAAGFESAPANRSSSGGFEAKPGSGMWMIPEPEAAWLVQNAKSLLQGVTLSVERKRREVVGIRFADAPEDSLLLQRGWRIGDVLTKVNGTPIRSEAELRSYIAENHERFSLYRFEFLRDGEVMHLSYRLVAGE